VAVAGVATTVVKRQFALAVLFDCELSCAHNIVPKEILHCKESYL